MCVSGTVCFCNQASTVSLISFSGLIVLFMNWFGERNCFFRLLVRLLTIYLPDTAFCKQLGIWGIWV